MNMVAKIRSQDGFGRVLHGQKRKDLNIGKEARSHPVSNGAQQGRGFTRGHAMDDGVGVFNTCYGLFRGGQLSLVFLAIHLEGPHLKSFLKIIDQITET